MKKTERHLFIILISMDVHVSLASLHDPMQYDICLDDILYILLIRNRY